MIRHYTPTRAIIRSYPSKWFRVGLPKYYNTIIIYNIILIFIFVHAYKNHSEMTFLNDMILCKNIVVLSYSRNIRLDGALIRVCLFVTIPFNNNNNLRVVSNAIAFRTFSHSPRCFTRTVHTIVYNIIIRIDYWHLDDISYYKQFPFTISIVLYGYVLLFYAYKANP